MPTPIRIHFTRRPPAVPEGYRFVGYWPTSQVLLSAMARQYGRESRCMAPAKGHRSPLVILPLDPKQRTWCRRCGCQLTLSGQCFICD